MPETTTKATIRAYIEEVWNNASTDSLNGLVCDDFKYILGSQPPRDKEMVHSAFPINLLVQGLSQPCCAYPVVPSAYNALGQIAATDCIQNLLLVSGSVAMISPNDGCICGAESALPTENTTWGNVKALYGE
jgi:hypothetical protein